MDAKKVAHLDLEPRVDGLDELQALAEDATLHLTAARESIERMLDITLEVNVYGVTGGGE